MLLGLGGDTVSSVKGKRRSDAIVIRTRSQRTDCSAPAEPRFGVGDVINSPSTFQKQFRIMIRTGPQDENGIAEFMAMRAQRVPCLTPETPRILQWPSRSPIERKSTRQ